jgi:predicted kinase
MAKKILIMGLPESGKTSLAKLLAPMFNAVLINEDEVRKEANDFDLSEVGRSIHTNRMKRLADEAIQNNRNVVADFECTDDERKDFNADYIIYMDTIKESKLEPPSNFDFKVTHKCSLF